MALVNANLSDIRDEILKSSMAQRIIIKVQTKILDSQDYRGSAYRIVSEIFPDWERDSRILFLAIEIWGERVFLVIDVNHNDYNFKTAHKSTAILPVSVLREHRRSERGWNLIRWPQEDRPIAKTVADLHNANGFDVPTLFLANYNSPVLYSNPRHLSE